MGILINPGADQWARDRNRSPFVDKSLLIGITNSMVNTNKRYICISRPRRFGKTMAAGMLSAYYGRGLCAEELFEGLNISAVDSFHQYANQFDVIYVDMRKVLSGTKNVSDLVEILSEEVEEELFALYPRARRRDDRPLSYYLERAAAAYGTKFVFILDEWDCIFREYPQDEKSQRKYLDFLRDVFKDRNYVALACMTGILPIKKDGTHSSLNMFTEYSMENPGKAAPFTGFTEEEVEHLCQIYHRDMDLCRQWYNGYSFPKCAHIYHPEAIVEVMNTGEFRDYWSRPETDQALQVYINMNFDGLRDAVIRLLAGERIRIDTGSFQNDMITFSRADDVLTLLIHLGYLGYDREKEEVFIPNRETAAQFVTVATSETGGGEKFVRAESSAHEQDN